MAINTKEEYATLGHMSITLSSQVSCTVIIKRPRERDVYEMCQYYEGNHYIETDWITISLWWGADYGAGKKSSWAALDAWLADNA